MEQESPPDRVLTVPNVLSAIRLVLIPVFIYVAAGRARQRAGRWRS